MALIWLNRIRLLQRIVGGRHIQRPYFDFETPLHCNSILLYLGSLNSGQLRSLIYSVNKGLTRPDISTDIYFSHKNIAVNRTIKKSSIVMALNKLSIDKVELADKKVLIRFVSHFYDIMYVL